MNPQRTLRRLLAGAPLALISAPVGASSLASLLHVERSEQALDCPSGDALASQVEQILQRSLSGANAVPESVRIEVRFARTRDGYSADVRFRGPKPGERALSDRGQQCGALAQAVSVTIALLLDKELAGDGRAKPPDSSKQAPPAAPVVARSSRHAPNAGTEPRGWQLRGAAEGGAGWLTSSRPRAVFALELGVRAKRWIVEAGVASALAETVRFGAGEVRTSLLFGTARACYSLGDRLSFGPCAAFGLGSLRGRGLGYVESRSVALLWSAVGLGVLLEGELGSRGFWGVSGVGWLPTRRQTFSVERVGTGWESPVFAGTLSLRGGVRLW